MASQKTNFQIRGFPAALHKQLRRRASRKGVSMSRYVLEILRDNLSKPTMEEWLEELRKNRRAVKLSRPAAEFLREARREEGFEG